MSLRFEWDEDKAARHLRKHEIVFPPLVIGMTEVGEQTGHEPEIFRELSRVLDRRVRAARAEFIAADHPDHTELKTAYLDRFPDAAPLFQLGDFSIVAFVPATARLVAGFARAVTLPPEALATAVTKPG